MLKVHILTTCSHCNVEAYKPKDESEDCLGQKSTRYVPCPICKGSGNEPKRVDMEDFDKLLHQT
jgi:hypothetical protein